MRVQRAPSAADQPQLPPPASGVERASFSAHVELDLTDLLSRLDEPQVVGEVIARLVTACRHELVIDDACLLQVVRLTDEGLVGRQLGPAVDQSAYGISSGLLSTSPVFVSPVPRTLTVLHLSGSRVRAVGEWGWGGVGVVTLGGAVPTLAPSPQHGLSITQRWVAPLGFTVPESSRAQRVVRALDAVARSVEHR